jgi:hypothetical protein
MLSSLSRATEDLIALDCLIFMQRADPERNGSKVGLLVSDVIESRTGRQVDRCGVEVAINRAEPGTDLEQGGHILGSVLMSIAEARQLVDDLNAVIESAEVFQEGDGWDEAVAKVRSRQVDT